ncbi:MAG: hypothetical protein JNK25_03525 [Phycisphaerae bacterium]|nr:hypothetical protein [Phycisphaerae bacterium]
MAKKKMTAREKLEVLLDETVQELSDEYRRKCRESYEFSRALRAELDQKLVQAKEDHRAALFEATNGYYKTLAQIVNTGLLALKLDATPVHAVSELIGIAHSAIPKDDRSDFGVPTKLAVPLKETEIPPSPPADEVGVEASAQYDSLSDTPTTLDLSFDPAPPPPCEMSALDDSGAEPAAIGGNVTAS